ncbi:hypothetical protein LCGC14_1367930 [marine sediment metagenome]|uniref:Lipoprotein n=1 Tax=marine sediment metagenome TaxID=412755 RepID=A0A0F9K6J4_9ZZZZ|nr:hypothetical protein [Methylophaga sp.]HEC59716.1 hypothetical protein [Methylophaga sp.]
MFYKTRFLLSSILICSALVACGDNDNDAAKTAETATTTNEVAPASTTEAATAPAAENATTPATEAATSGMTESSEATDAAMPTDKIEAGMKEEAVTDLLGKPSLTQTHTLDSLTLTHSEWTNDSGTTSVQFENGVVKFHQFTPAN